MQMFNLFGVLIRDMVIGDIVESVRKQEEI